MKLTVQCVRNNGARLGRMVDVGCHGNYTIDTPACMMYTRLGSAPHLSSDMLQKLQDIPALTHFPLTLIAQYRENIAGYKEGLAKFAALPDGLVFTSVYDPAVKVPTGYNDNNGVGVFGRSGKVKLDVEEFMAVQEAVLPDWFQCMADCDTTKESTKKRARKSVDRTLRYLDDILDRHKNSERLKRTCLFGSLVGGYDKQERERCVKETAARNVDGKFIDGYVIEGFHSMGPETENFSLEDVKDIVDLIIKHLPEDRPRMMLSAWRPDTVLQAIEMGVDLFDSSYAYLVTERGCAMSFDYRYSTDPEADKADHQTEQGFTINLKEPRYTEDFGPLLKDCTCYACKNFTRAYVNHLLNTSELLASTLLMLHNVHHYTRFFTQIRQALADDQFDQLKHVIQKQAEIKTSDT